MARVALVIGESLVDVVRRDGRVTEFPGGSAANVAVALARLGRPVRLATAYADDAHGRLLSLHHRANGLLPAGDPASIGQTSRAIATIGEDGAAAYEFDIDWLLNPIDLGDDEPMVVHTSSLAAVLAPGCDDVHAACVAERGRATISYDVNARPRVTGTGPEILARVERLVGVSDVVKASDEDLEALYPDRTVEESARHLLALGPAVVAVTRGGEGALWVAAREWGYVDPVPVEVADTIGAGDTFGAALLDALWSRDLLGAGRRASLHAMGGSSWHDVLAYAARAAAVTVSRPGADPPHRHELG